ncbi:MAG TPA: DedA family protein [Dehalococcoidia bacterium]|nr:DedA family protein [Dehalococcoidia bacterium]
MNAAPAAPGSRSREGEPRLSQHLEQSILDFVRNVYSAIGWPGVVLLMAVESAGIPVPSEVIMPLAGWFLVQDRGHGLWFVLIAGLLGGLGNTIGSIVAYWIGDYGGRPLLLRWGRYVLISGHDLDRADEFFARRGGPAVFVSRVLPVVRTFISFPAGIARMRFDAFVLFTFAGSFLWSLALAWAGYLLGANYHRVRDVLRPFDYPIAALIVLAIGWFVWRHIRRARREVGVPDGADQAPSRQP